MALGDDDGHGNPLIDLHGEKAAIVELAAVLEPDVLHLTDGDAGDLDLRVLRDARGVVHQCPDRVAFAARRPLGDELVDEHRRDHRDDRENAHLSRGR